MLADQFTDIFRVEHRRIRDLLLDLITAFQARDPARARTLLGETAEATGPHFRYEEEAMYPALVEIFGPTYIEQLLGDHDRAIGTARRLVELAGQPSFSDSDVTEATELVRRLLPHVSDCDGLSIMVERLAEEKVANLLATRERAWAANLDLLRWASEVRPRPAAVIR